MTSQPVIYLPEMHGKFLMGETQLNVVQVSDCQYLSAMNIVVLNVDYLNLDDSFVFWHNSISLMILAMLIIRSQAVLLRFFHIFSDTGLIVPRGPSIRLSSSLQNHLNGKQIDKCY